MYRKKQEKDWAIWSYHGVMCQNDADIIATV